MVTDVVKEIVKFGPCPTARALPAPQTVRHKNSSLSPTQILVVEDEETLSQSISYSLHRSEFEIFVAKDLLGAKQLAARFRPDVMLIDLDLKTQSGLEVAEKLQWFAPTLAVPMILIFGDDLASAGAQIEALHNYLFLAKPVSIQALMQAVVEAADLV